MSDVKSLADEYWAYFRSTEQLWNIDRGDLEQIAHWEDLSPDGVAKRIGRLTHLAEVADGLMQGDTPEADAATLASISFSARANAAGLPWARDRALLSAPTGFAAFLSVMLPRYPLATISHGEGYLTKLAGFGRFVDGWMEGVREGVSEGRVPTARGVEGSIAKYDSMLAADVADDPLATQLPPTDASPSEAATWRTKVDDVIATVVRPALVRLRTTLSDDVLPHARSDDEAGISYLPGGEDAYAALLWASTSTAHTPAELHQLGLQQLGGLDDEYRSIAGPLLGIHDPAEIRDRLRTDTSLRYQTSEEIVRDAEMALARAQAEAPRWFNRLPVAPCVAVAVDGGWGAYYSAPSHDGNQSGTFFFNTLDPSAWSRYSLEATTFHESIPGHHLQLALAQELDLHPVHGELEVTSYEEGWGLYAERLADEMGLYSSPMARIGMLSMDSLRAGRLVVDTGIHAMGWSRSRAIDYLFEYTAQSRQHTAEEIDRYIANPGQATAYMVGRLEIDRLRRESQARLGSHFDLRQFHDAIIGGGMMPLQQLSRRVEAWAVRMSGMP